MGINKNKLRMENEKLPKVLKLKDVEDDQKNRPKEMTWLIDNLVDKDYAKVNKVDILKDKKMLIILYTADFCGGAKHFVENLKTYMKGGSDMLALLHITPLPASSIFQLVYILMKKR